MTERLQPVARLSADGLCERYREAVGPARAAAPGAAVEVWAFDEHRRGLYPITRKLRASAGRCRCPSTRVMSSLAAMVSGRRAEGLEDLIRPVNAAACQAMLEAIAQEVGAGRDKSVILVLDNAA